MRNGSRAPGAVTACKGVRSISHYSVAVFSKTGTNEEYERLLAPFSETDDRYKTWHIVKPEDVEDLRKQYLKLKNKYPKYDWHHFVKGQGYYEEGGVLGYYANDDAKWDYYTLGARSDEYEVKPGVKNPEKISDYQISTPADATQEQKDEIALEYRRMLGEDPWPNNEMPAFCYKQEYVRKRWPTLETYMTEQLTDSPYAFLTPDGVWHAPGNVGWFAYSNDTVESYAQYLKDWLAYINAHPDMYVSFVDCHI